MVAVIERISWETGKVQEIIEVEDGEKISWEMIKVQEIIEAKNVDMIFQVIMFVIIRII